MEAYGMRYDRAELLRFLETLRDEMMRPMNPFERSKWVAERAYSITGVLVAAKEES
ncbi:MAG: hypothetical protein KGI38_12110 [Thaumarchaeota archaeon]|nr:hypothetical protein [Nitrososphaerota archaeon]